MAIDINSFAQGAVAERLDAEFDKVLKNMADPNTDPKAKRTITITLSITGDTKREIWDCSVKATSKLAPAHEVGSRIIVGRDREGNIVGQELVSGVKGQMFIDTEGDISNDVGEKIEDAAPQETTSGVVDFRQQKTN
ncbi:hypothetical protein BAMA_16235 [Bacillus manliponensis]|uniref:Replication terminator protein n=1 Tax=Bacillus manliponensis TaxID=574376 RepID=A0A073JSS0_9BACI|nr:hypothetical protein [Bacillus manliponensis]KEK17241.1 hypothetical protein BAMA_16235 [Bacillus manliponensis]